MEKTAYGSLPASGTFLQWLLACLNFTLDSEDFFCRCKWKQWFLWAMAAVQAAENHVDEWGLTWYWEIYINSNLSPLPKFTSSSGSTKFQDVFMEHVLHDHEDHPNEHNNCHKLCDEIWHPLLSLKESQWKWRQQHDQNFPVERKPFLKKY